MLSAPPRVSVGIPVYRGEKYILEAIASVRADEFTDWEILVFIDGSPDSSAQLVSQVEDPRIRVISSAANVGLVTARNRILHEARGEFLAWLDQDDLNYSNRLAKQVEFLDAHPDVAMVASWTDLKVESHDGSTRTFTHVRPSTHAEIRATMLFTNPIACNTVMMRLKSFRDLGLTFREEFGNSLDYDLWSRASDSLIFHALKQPLSAYRVHSEQTSRGAELRRMSAQALQVQAEFLHRNLDILMSPDERELHESLTQIPMPARDGDVLEPAKEWFRRVRTANDVTHQVDSNALDLVITAQWFRIVTSCADLSRWDQVRHSLTGAHDIGPSWRHIVNALRSALVRRRVRR